MNVCFDAIYAEASNKTGKTKEQLRAMADLVFASMLSHALNDPGRIIITMLKIQKEDGAIDLEVDLPPRSRTRHL